MDPMDLKWYTAILEECKSLDINNFLYDVSLYVVNRLLLPQRAASNSLCDSSRPTAKLRHHLIETVIFGLGETAQERSFAPRQDTPLSSERSHKFDQFGSMQEEMYRDPDVFVVEVENLVSLNQ